MVVLLPEIHDETACRSGLQVALLQEAFSLKPRRAAPGLEISTNVRL
jgi:hypothetical protein